MFLLLVLISSLHHSCVLDNIFLYLMSLITIHVRYLLSYQRIVRLMILEFQNINFFHNFEEPRITINKYPILISEMPIENLNRICSGCLFFEELAYRKPGRLFRTIFDLCSTLILFESLSACLVIEDCTIISREIRVQQIADAVRTVYVQFYCNTYKV